MAQLRSPCLGKVIMGHVQEAFQLELLSTIQDIHIAPLIHLPLIPQL